MQTNETDIFYTFTLLLLVFQNQMYFKRGCGCFHGDGGSGGRWRSWRLPKTNPFTFARPSIGASISEEEQLNVPLSRSRPTIVSSLVEDPFVLLCLRHNRNKSSLHEGPGAAVGELDDEQIDFFDPVVQEERSQLKHVSITEEVVYSMLPKYLQLESHGQGDSKFLESTWVTEFTKSALKEKMQETMMDHNRHHDEGYMMHQPLSRASGEWEAGHGEGINDDDHVYVLLSSSSEFSACYPEDMYFSSFRVHDSLSAMDALSKLDEDPCPFDENPRESSSVLTASSYSKHVQAEAGYSPSSIPSHEPRKANDGVKAIILDQDILVGNYNFSKQEQVGAAAPRASIPGLHPRAIKGIDEVKDIIVDQEDEDMLDELNAILDEEDDLRNSKESTEAQDISLFFQTGESGRSKDPSIYQELTKFLEDALFQEVPGNGLDELIKELHQYEEERQNNDAQVAQGKRKEDRKQHVKEGGEEHDLLEKAKEKLASLMDSIKGPIEQKMEVPTINKDMWLSVIEKNLDKLLFPEFQSPIRDTVNRRNKDSRRSKTKDEYRGADTSLPVKSRKSKVMYCYEQVNGIPLGRIETIDKVFDDDVIVASSCEDASSSASSSFLSQYTGESTGESELGEYRKGPSTDDDVGPEDEIRQDANSSIDNDAGPEDEIRQDTNVIKLFWRYDDDDDDDELSTEDPSTDYTSTDEELTTNDQHSLSTTNDLSVSTDKSQSKYSLGKLMQQVLTEKQEPPPQTKAPPPQTRKGRNSKLLQTRHQKMRSGLRRLPGKFRRLLKNKVPVASM